MGANTVATIDHYGDLMLEGWDNIMLALITPSVDILSQLSDAKVYAKNRSGEWSMA